MNIMKSGLVLKKVNTVFDTEFCMEICVFRIISQPKRIIRGEGKIYENKEMIIQSSTFPQYNPVNFFRSKGMLSLQGSKEEYDNRLININSNAVPKVKRAITDMNNEICQKNKTYIY